ncbi:MAG: eCIS core domain-containing protein, partial [Caldimonas sp.]
MATATLQRSPAPRGAKSRSGGQAPARAKASAAASGSHASVRRQPAASIPRSTACACGGSCPRCAADPRPVSGQVLDSPGEALSSALRDRFEPRFGADFSAVRVHRGGAAEDSARALSARAFT